MLVKDGQYVKLASMAGARRPLTHLAILFCSATAMAPFSASAQQSQSKTRRIDLDASVRLQYDSNVVLSDPTLSDGKPKGDVSAAPSFNANIFLPRATGDFYLTGSLGYNFNRRYTRLNRESVRLTTGADQQIASCIVHGEVGYSRQLTDLANLLQGSTAASITNTEEHRNYAADVGCDTPIGIRPSVAVSRSEIRNNLDLRKFADSDTMSYTGQLGYRASAIGTVSIFGRYADINYLYRKTADGREDGAKSYAAGVQLERSLGTRFTFVGSLNYTKVDPKLSQTKGFSGLGFASSAIYRGDLFQLTLTGSRAAQPSQLLFVAYDIQTAVGATLDRQLSQKLRLGFRARYLRREFAPSSAFSAAPTPGKDNLLTLSGTLGYSATQRLKVSLDTTYQKRTTDIQLYKFNNTRFAITTSLSL